MTPAELDACARCGASKDRHAMPRLTGACGQFVPDLLTDNAVAALAAPTTGSVTPHPDTEQADALPYAAATLAATNAMDQHDIADDAASCLCGWTTDAPATSWPYPSETHIATVVITAAAPILLDAAEERARTAEAEVERLTERSAAAWQHYDEEMALNTEVLAERDDLRSQRDAARAEATAAREAVARTIEAAGREAVAWLARHASDDVDRARLIGAEDAYKDAIRIARALDSAPSGEATT